MTRRRYAALTFAIFLSGVALQGADTSVPFHATIDTQPVVTGFCGPACLQLEISGTGNATHMGLMSTEGPSQVNLAGATQTGHFTLGAANGDSLEIDIGGSVVFTGADPADPVTFTGHWTVTSGTGRFAKVSGGGTYHGSAAGPAGVLVMDGGLTGIGRGR